ncbi:MAG: type II secretion system minor pseudopilin GspK [Steroidobacteraceae bacterium]
MRAPSHRQRGIALLTAIMLFAIATVLAVAIGFATTMTARRAVANSSFDTALMYSQGAEALAAVALTEDQNNEDSPDESWAQPYGPVEIAPDALITAQLEDLDGRFNINSLIDKDGVADPVAVATFTRLLEILGLESKWAQLLTDWIDIDNQPTLPDGGEDSYYLAQTPPYRPPNLPVTTITELMSLPGFDIERFNRLAPHITALPPDPQRKINLCTASGAVLDALHGTQLQFSLDEAALQRNRERGCFPTPDTFLDTVSAEARQQISDRVGKTSADFLLTSYVTIGTTEMALYSLVQRDRNQIRVIRRSQTPN